MRIVTLALSTALLLGVGACNKQVTDPGPGRSPEATASGSDLPSTAAEPTSLAGNRKAAVAAARTYAARIGSGDYAGVWEMLRKDDQALLSKADYVKISKKCAGPEVDNSLSRLKTTFVRFEGPRTALVRFETPQGASMLDATLRLEGDEWRYQLGKVSRKMVETKGSAC